MNHFEYAFFDELVKQAENKYYGSPASKILAGIAAGSLVGAIPAMAEHAEVKQLLAEKGAHIPEMVHKFKSSLMAHDLATNPELHAQKSKIIDGFFFDKPSIYDQQAEQHKKELMKALEDQLEASESKRSAAIGAAAPKGGIIGGLLGSLLHGAEVHKKKSEGHSGHLGKVVRDRISNLLESLRGNRG